MVEVRIVVTRDVGGSELEWNMKGLWGVTDDLGADLFSL